MSKSDKTGDSGVQEELTSSETGIPGFLRGNRPQACIWLSLPGSYPINTRFRPIPPGLPGRAKPQNRDKSGQGRSSQSPYPGLGRSLSPGCLLLSRSGAVAVHQSVTGSGVGDSVPRVVTGWTTWARCIPASLYHPGYTPLLHHVTAPSPHAAVAVHWAESSSSLGWREYTGQSYPLP